jgi:hypothetical protein
MSGKLIQDKIWGYHSGDYYNHSLVECNMDMVTMVGAGCSEASLKSRDYTISHPTRK